jgi:hypothetical protein
MPQGARLGQYGQAAPGGKEKTTSPVMLGELTSAITSACFPTNVRPRVAALPGN